MNQTAQTMLTVEGMTCPSCLRRVTAALQGVEGVTAVEVKRREKVARIEHRPGLEPRRFIEALAEAGYDASAMESGAQAA